MPGHERRNSGSAAGAAEAGEAPAGGTLLATPRASRSSESDATLRPSLLHQYFEEQVALGPDRAAIVDPSGTLTYLEAEQAANRLARLLRARGVGPGICVGLYLARGANAYVSLLAILKSGGAYVPLDLGYPADRISYILSDSRARVLITVKELAENVPFEGTVVALDEESEALASQSAERLTPAETGVTPEDLAYLIYTSGSTGKPKGVEIEHRSVCNLVQVERDLFRVGPEDRVFQGFSIAFDASVEEIWLAFASGAALFAGSRETVTSGPLLSQILTRAGITVLSTVPTLLLMLEDDIPTVRLLILGGEACPADLVKRWAKPGRRMFNTYGPTEATVIATAWECVPGKPVTIGGPLPTYQAFLLDESLKPVPAGTAGELYLGGIGLARGYVGRPDLTAERFLNDPFGPGKEPARLYRTGDVGRWTSDGEIEYLGRADSQVKLRGFRVELGEIEAVLLEYPGVQAAAVNVQKDSSGIDHLVGYVVLREGGVLDEDAARTALRGRLPAYMVPALLEILPQLPTLPSGKVDRRSLPAPRPRQPRSGTSDPPRTELEKQIAAVWQTLFAPLPVSIKDDFFLDLGGHSLLATRTISELRHNPLMHNLAVRDLYKNPTVASLAAYVERQNQAQAAPATSEEDDEVETEFAPVSAGAHRLCGLLQLAGLYLILGVFSLQLLGPYLIFHWLVARGHSTAVALAFAGVSVVATYPLMLALAILVKWIVIGRFRVGEFPLWGFYYFRWWLVKTVLSVVPTRYLTGTPVFNIYLRLLGAKIGKNVYIGTNRCLAADLLTIGDDTHIGAETALASCTVERGLLKIEPIAIGQRCFIGGRCVLGPGSRMGDDAWLGDLSLVRAHGVIMPGKRRSGSPAAPMSRAERPLSPRDAYRAGLGRRIGFGCLALLGLTAIPVFLVAAILPGLYALNGLSDSLGGHWYLLFTPVAALSFVLLFGLEIVVCKWLLLGKEKAGTHRLYGWHHFRKWFVDQLLDLALDVLLPLHASVYQVPWYRLLGARIGRRAEISTATGISPDLITIGDKSFIADSVALGAARVEGGHVAVADVRIGTQTFVGNSALVPPGTDIGDGCLIGCLSTPPTAAADARRPGTSWLGSPPFFLPKRQDAPVFAEQQTFQPTRKLWLQRAAVEAVRILLPPSGFLVLSCLLLSGVLWLQRDVSTWAAVLAFPLLFGACGLAACLFTVALKWAVMGRYVPRERPLWSPFVWGSELVTCVHEALADVFLVWLLRGTPFICWYFRLLGTRIGKRVFLDTTDITEFDLVELGDDAALNELCTLQTHLFEDRVMKMSHVRIEKECCVGTSAVVLYDTRMAAGATLESLSLMMKGETLPAGTAWTGIPAIPVDKSQLRTFTVATRAR